MSNIVCLEEYKRRITDSMSLDDLYDYLLDKSLQRSINKLLEVEVIQFNRRDT